MEKIIIKEENFIYIKFIFHSIFFFFLKYLQFFQKKKKKKTFCFRIGVVYCKEDQTQESEMFENKPSQAFTEFLECIGEKIDLMGWGGYRGQLCVTCKRFSPFFFLN